MAKRKSKSESNSPQHNHYIAIVAIVAVVAVVILVMNGMQTSTPVEDMAMEEVMEAGSEAAIAGEAASRWAKAVPQASKGKGAKFDADSAKGISGRSKFAGTIIPSETVDIKCPSHIGLDLGSWSSYESFSDDYPSNNQKTWFFSSGKDKDGYLNAIFIDDMRSTSVDRLKIICYYSSLESSSISTLTDSKNEDKIPSSSSYEYRLFMFYDKPEDASYSSLDDKYTLEYKDCYFPTQNENNIRCTKN